MNFFRKKDVAELTPLERLYESRKRILLNRNICGILLIFLTHNAWSVIKEGNTPLWFYFAMGAILLGIMATGIFGHLQAKKLLVEITKMEKEQHENAEIKPETDTNEQNRDNSLVGHWEKPSN